MNKVPSSLEEAFDILDELISEEEVQELRSMSLDSFIGRTHHGMGRWLRNNWNLWKEEGPLYDYFVDLGLEHADDMSGVILTSYWRKKNGKDLDVKKQVVKYQKYWLRMKKNSL